MWYSDGFDSRKNVSQFKEITCCGWEATPLMITENHHMQLMLRKRNIQSFHCTTDIQQRSHAVHVPDKQTLLPSVLIYVKKKSNRLKVIARILVAQNEKKNWKTAFYQNETTSFLLLRQLSIGKIYSKIKVKNWLKQCDYRNFIAISSSQRKMSNII